MSTDFDSPWKEALDLYFEPFLVLLFPAVHSQIDWSRGWESLDKEFQQVVREAEHGRRYVDKLVKVWTNVGVEIWVLIHVEVQTTRDADFPLRMFVYHYRIFDRYNKPVASLAVLADDDAAWRPEEYRQNLFGCESSLRFPAVKLLDFAAKEAELEASDNPFAKVVLAHLETQRTHGNPADRQVSKVRLARGLYERGFGSKDVRELFRLIDWLMALPPTMQDAFLVEIDRMQMEKKMPYIPTSERVGHRRGLRRAIELALKLRFGEKGLTLIPEITADFDEEQLEAIIGSIETAADVEEVRRFVVQLRS